MAPMAEVIDPNKCGEAWEDICDNLIADLCAGEPTKTLEEFETELAPEGLAKFAGTLLNGAAT